jgi:NAD(P)-dependent dehydrogenase (short-subunit alcohol dehydrogenase family)
MAFTNEQFSLTGKVAIVTGAGGREHSIGRAYALGLANAGATVVCADINVEGAQKVADEIVAGGGNAIAVQVDITDRASTAAMAAQAVDAFGGIDILVNNAALMVEIVATARLIMRQRILHAHLRSTLLARSIVQRLARRRWRNAAVDGSSTRYRQVPFPRSQSTGSQRSRCWVLPLHSQANWGAKTSPSTLLPRA